MEEERRVEAEIDLEEVVETEGIEGKEEAEEVQTKRERGGRHLYLTRKESRPAAQEDQAVPIEPNDPNSINFLNTFR